jgi:hypothetical protein
MHALPSATSSNALRGVHGSIAAVSCNDAPTNKRTVIAAAKPRTRSLRSRETDRVASTSRLVLSATVDIPVREASGVTVRRAAGTMTVMVVGDATAEVAICRVGTDGDLAEWSVLDLGALPGWPLPPGDSQFESIASDGGSLVAVMREDPPVVLVADTTTRELRAEIELAAPKGSLLDGHWDDPSSRGEGMTLLRGGRLLIAQEKRPQALIEFGPVGATPRGLSVDDFLGPGESWDAPSGSTRFVPLSMWTLNGKAKKALRDISSIAVGDDRALWLLSDKSACLAMMALDDPLPATSGSIERFDGVWALPKSSVKPEGIAALEPGRVLVVMDTTSTTGNGIIATRPTA